MKLLRPESSGRGWLGAVCLALAPSASATVVNLTDDLIAGNAPSTLTAGSTTFVGGILNGALYRRPFGADDSKAGSGIFRDLYRVDSNSGSESGYNRDEVMDADVPNGFDPVITVGDLVEDASGTAYVFVVDTNEPGNATAQYVSLDDFQIFVGGTTDPDPLPQTQAGMDSQLGMNVYSMNTNGEQHHVLLDYSLFSGSGEMDLFIFVPKSNFAGLPSDSLVYVYSEFGGYTGAPGFDPAAGPEQVSIPGKAIDNPVDPLIESIPEPSTIALAGLGLALTLRRRRA